MEKLHVPQGDFTLIRYPHRKKETLRAWDAADELLLNELHVSKENLTSSQVVILNDGFGALSVALSQHNPMVISDSSIALKAIQDNLKNNAIEESSVNGASSSVNIKQDIDFLLIKIPKSLAQLEQQLHEMREHLKPGSKIIAAGMVKVIHTSTLALFEKIIGPTTTSLATKKARLIHCQFDESIKPGKNPYPSEYLLEKTNYRIINHAGVFSRESLDIGSRFLIEHLPASEKKQTIVDLGCGNGVIGLIAAEKNPKACLIFTDESYAAIASAKATFESAFGETRQAEFKVTDCLAGIEDNSIDVILNNPPFHQHNAVSNQVASQMFNESKRALKTGGELWVVGNRHLDYHLRLKRLFGNYVNIASNKKFIILKAVKR